MRGRSLGICLILLSLAAIAPGSAQDTAKTESQLRQLRTEIERIRSQVAKDAAEQDRLTRSLRSAEQAARKARGELDRLRNERLSREKRRDELAVLKVEKQAELQRKREELAAQMRAAYLLGRQDPLKWLLDTDDPASINRLFTYHGYFSRQQAGQLEAIERDVRELAELETKLEEERDRLVKLEGQQAGEFARLDGAREERRKVLAALTEESKARAASLRRLQREQQALQKLLQELRRSTQRFPSDPRSTFAQMRGKLSWPVSGRIVARFGTQRAGTVRWEGVLISAARGAPVRSVHRGRVVYADWLAGLGLLLIIDHGGGYLTLYGHNEQLFRAVGDQVNAGDIVAEVGDSGGRPQPELYFEIRQGARPVDPTPWFGSRQP